MTRLEPCDDHYSAIMGPHALEWHRCLEVAEDCSRCRIVDDWDGHPLEPVSDDELRRLIAADLGFGPNPLSTLHSDTPSTSVDK